jgi:hypothetical protein
MHEADFSAWSVLEFRFFNAVQPVNPATWYMHMYPDQDLECQIPSDSHKRFSGPPQNIRPPQGLRRLQLTAQRHPTVACPPDQST